MAKKNLKDDVTQDGQTAAEEQAQTKTENGRESDDKEGRVIVPIGYSVKLREIHPQATYGRSGYRFNKTESVYLAAGDLTAEQVLTLAEDPWLELVPVCEE